MANEPAMQGKQGKEFTLISLRVHRIQSHFEDTPWMGFMLRSSIRFSCAFWCSSSNVSGIGSYTNAFSSNMPIRLMDVAMRAAPTQAFHSPVGCFISAKSLQRWAGENGEMRRLNGHHQHDNKSYREHTYQDITGVFLEADGRHRVVDTVSINWQTVPAVSDHFPFADLLRDHVVGLTGAHLRTQRIP
uniref:Uncharacterized protein n=1 Tax=Anopheles minimus TaxID=112268 RepID=A0A182VTH5_9DIPT